MSSREQESLKKNENKTTKQSVSFLKAGVHKAEEYARDSDFQERIKNKQGSIYFVYQVIIILIRRENPSLFLSYKNHVFHFSFPCFYSPLMRLKFRRKCEIIVLFFLRSLLIGKRRWRQFKDFKKNSCENSHWWLNAVLKVRFQKNLGKNLRKRNYIHS